MLHVMGEDRSERLDIVPAQFRVIVTRRPKYACRSCEEIVVQAPAPSRLVESGIPTEATVAPSRLLPPPLVWCYRMIGELQVSIISAGDAAPMAIE
jgi:hypothetical protein